MMGQEALFPQRGFAFTSEILSCEGQDSFWEYYHATNRLFVYGRDYIMQVYGIDAPFIEYDFDDYVETFCDKQSQQVLRDDIKTALTNRTGYNNIHRIRNPVRGTCRIIQAFGLTRGTAQGLMLCGICQDISDMVGFDRPDALFVEAEKRVRILLDASPTACTFYDEHLKIIDANKQAVALFQCASKQELLEQFYTFSPEFQPDGRKSGEKKLCLLNKVMESGKEMTEWWYRLPNGESLPAEVTLVRIPWNEASCVANHIRDLRPVFESRAKEREADERSLTMLHSMPLSCTLWTKDGRLLDCNEAALKLFEVASKEEFLNRFFDLSPEYQDDGLLSREQVLNLIREAAITGEQHAEWTHLTASGEPFPVELILVRVKWKDDYYIAAYVRDLRHFKAYLREIEKAQEELIAARNRAEQSALAKSEFLANMSHEIRTPMNGIIGMTKLMLHGEISEKQRFYVNTIDNSAKHLLRIVNDILEFTKIDTGKMEFEQVIFSFQKILGELIDTVMPGIEAKNLSMSLLVDPRIPDTLIGDSFRLTQVLLQLFSNGVKFTWQGGIRLHIRLEEPSDPQQVTLRFSVTDTGIGLSEEQIRGLFVPFSQADSSVTRKYGGTGLGLAICRKILTCMGGTIWCESALGKGTVFNFTLPFGKASPQQPPIYHRAAGKRVFALIDDKTPQTTLRLHHQLLGCDLTLSFEREHWERNVPPGVDFILITWEDIRLHIKGVLETYARHYGSRPPDLLISVSDREDQAFINSLDHSCHILYRPVTIPALYSHIYESLTADQDAPETPDRDQPAIPESIRGARILLVEDNEINQLMASEMLVMEGFKVDIAGNGREAVEMVSRNQYDMVLMDIQMPEMDGLTATRLIRQSSKDLPILALTAHAAREDREKSLAAGMNDHITKPIDPGLLFATFARWIH